MKNILDLLESIGLSEKEALMYTTSLKFPNQPISILAKKATQNRGTAFVILHELLKKGLVKKTTRGKVMHFTAVQPKELLYFLEKKKHDIEKKVETLSEYMHEFENIQGEETRKPIFQFYEGMEGMHNLLKEMISGEHTLIQGISSSSFLEHTFSSDVLSEIERRRMKKNVRMNLLIPYHDHECEVLTSSETKARETRYIPEPLTFPMSTFIFGNTVTLFSHSEDYGLSIQSSEYASMQRTFFMTLWALSKTTVSKLDFRMPLI